MSTAVMALVWPLQLEPSQKAVLVSLADQANDEGVCWPAIGTISTRTCFGERTVQRALQALEGAGFLVRDIRGGRSTMYQINLGSLRQSSLLPQGESASRGVTVTPRQGDTPVTTAGEGRQGDTTPPSPCHPTPVTVTPRTSKEPSGNRKHAAPPGAARAAQVEIAGALAAVTGTALDRMTHREQSKAFAAAKQIRDAGGDAEQVRARAARWPQVFRDAVITPLGIASHWGRLEGARGPTHDTQRAQHDAGELDARSRAEGDLRMLGNPPDLVRAEGESWASFADRTAAALRARSKLAVGT